MNDIIHTGSVFPIFDVYYDNFSALVSSYINPMFADPIFYIVSHTSKAIKLLERRVGMFTGSESERLRDDNREWEWWKKGPKGRKYNKIEDGEIDVTFKFL